MIDTERTVIVKSTHAGLGDLILGVLQGLMYCHLSGRRLVVDWKDTVYAPPDVNLFPELFELKPQAHAVMTGEPGTVRPHVWSGYLDQSIDQLLEIQGRPWDLDAYLKEFSAGLERIDYPESVVVLFDYRKFGTLRAHFRNEHAYLTRYTNRQILANLAKQYLVLTKELRETADAWRYRNIAGFTVGVHVRQTNESGGKSTNLQRVHSALGRLQRIYPVDRIFLCTDNVTIKEEFSSEYGNVVYREKWMPEPNEPVHLTVGRSDAGIQSAKDAVIDMSLLSKCDVMIYSSNSNFGFVASLWSNGYRNIDLSPQPSKIQHLIRRVKRFARGSGETEMNAGTSIKN